MFKKIFTLILLFLVSYTSFSLKNPSAVYCEAMNYTFKIIQTPGGEVGICVLPNGFEVYAWDFYLGRTALEYSYCSTVGLKPVHVVENQSEYLACQLENGSLVPVDKLMNLSFEETVCGDGFCGFPENYFTCPSDCPSGSRDGVCDKQYDGICDPDCNINEDIDCQLCGNGICDERENYITCPSDCPSGSRDGICDGIKDGRFDPDCYNYPWTDPDCSNIDYPCLNLTRSLENLELLQNKTCLCNHNGICEENETWYTCPTDCKPCSGNITCNGKVICNCYGDLECIKEEETRSTFNIPEEKIERKIEVSKAPMYIKLAIAFGIFLFIGYLLYKYYGKK